MFALHRIRIIFKEIILKCLFRCSADNQKEHSEVKHKRTIHLLIREGTVPKVYL